MPKSPEILSGNFDDTFKRHGLRIATSSDRKLRIWSWDDGTGGPLSGGGRTFASLAEFQTSTGIKTFKLGWGFRAGLCDSIFSVQSNNKKTIYLPIFIYVGDEGECNRDIKAFRIEGNKLNTKEKTFQAKTKLAGSIQIQFHCGRGWESHNFTVRDNGQILLVPFIDNEEEMTEKNLRYEFDGEHYINKGITKK